LGHLADVRRTQRWHDPAVDPTSSAIWGESRSTCGAVKHRASIVFKQAAVPAPRAPDEYGLTAHAMRSLRSIELEAKKMSADGTWQITVNTPMGAQATTLSLRTEGATLSGEQSADESTTSIYDGSIEGDEVRWKVDVTKPMALTVSFRGKIDGDTISGKAKAGMFPAMAFEGSRAS